MKKPIQAFSIIAALFISTAATAKPAEAGLFARLLGRRPPAQACGPNCPRGGCSTPRRDPAMAPAPSPTRSGCYTLPGGVRVCPVR
jgi:hypothetical protein